MRLTEFVLIAIVCTSCIESEDNKLLKIEGLEGRWKIIKQTKEGDSIEPLSQIYILTDGQTVLRTDTVYFEKTVFEFYLDSDNLYKNFNFLYQVDKRLNGLWTFDEKTQSIGFMPKTIISEQNDTIINGRSYIKSDFINYFGTRRIKVINNNKIILSSDNENLHLEKTN